MANHNPTPPVNQTGKTYNKSTAFNIKADIFKQFYLSPTSPTFCNIYQSAIRAGYTETYASNISVQRPKWWVELTESADYKRARMLQAAETALENTVTANPETDTQEKLKHDAAKFISERLGKDKYSTRQEVTGADGRRLFTNDNRDTAKMPLATLFKGVASIKDTK